MNDYFYLITYLKFQNQLPVCRKDINQFLKLSAMLGDKIRQRKQEKENKYVGWLVHKRLIDPFSPSPCSRELTPSERVSQALSPQYPCWGQPVGQPVGCYRTAEMEKLWYFLLSLCLQQLKLYLHHRNCIYRNFQLPPSYPSPFVSSAQAQ